MKTLILAYLLAFGVTTFTLSAQKKGPKVDKAKDLYLKGVDDFNRNKFDKAEEFFLKSIEENGGFIEAYLMLADTYNQQKEYQLESDILKKSLNIDSTFFIPTYYNLGTAYFNQGKYDEAIYFLEKYKLKTKDVTSKTKADRLLTNVKFSKYAIAHPNSITPINLGDSVNSCYDDYWPSLRGDGQELVYTVLVPRDSLLFTTKRLPRTEQYFQEDLYVSEVNKSGKWLVRKKLSSSINTLGNEGAQSLSADGKWMFFTGCGREDGKGSCDIYFSRKTQEGWSVPICLDYPINTALYESQPSFAADGKTLYFISNRAGGIGGNDLWMAQIVGIKNNGIPIFGNLRNLGSHINTKFDEASPYIHPDGKTLYFSSNGWTGMGQMDIFMSRQQVDNEWSFPVNLGYPINTSGDEIGFILNSRGDVGYFSSSRFNNIDKERDLYSFQMPDSLRPTPASYLKGRVFNIDSKEPLDAQFELLNLKNGELVAQSSTNYSGEFLICLPVGNNYALNVVKTGYLFYSQNVNLSKATTALEPIVADIFLKPISLNASIVLENIFFETNSATLLTESLVELSKLLQFLQNNPSVRIEISGHTDNVGSEVLNKSLSLRRAQAVMLYLTDKGVESTRLKAIGFGFSKPISTNDTEEGRAKNRRTEMRITQ